jgi:hypothetical protein
MSRASKYEKKYDPTIGVGNKYPIPSNKPLKLDNEIEFTKDGINWVILFNKKRYTAIELAGYLRCKVTRLYDALRQTKFDVWLDEALWKYDNAIAQTSSVYYKENGDRFTASDIARIAGIDMQSARVRISKWKYGNIPEERLTNPPSKSYKKRMANKKKQGANKRGAWEGLSSEDRSVNLRMMSPPSEFEDNVIGVRTLKERSVQ